MTTPNKYWLATVSKAIERSNGNRVPAGYELRISDHVPSGTDRPAHTWENEYIADSERRRGLEWPECLFVPIEPDGTRWAVRNETKDGLLAVIATSPNGASIRVDDAVLGHDASEKTRREYYSGIRDQWNFRAGECVLNRASREYAP